MARKPSQLLFGDTSYKKYAGAPKTHKTSDAAAQLVISPHLHPPAVLFVFHVSQKNVWIRAKLTTRGFDSEGKIYSCALPKAD